MNTPRIFETVACAPYLVQWPNNLSSRDQATCRKAVEWWCSAINRDECTVILCDEAGQHDAQPGAAPVYPVVWLETISGIAAQSGQHFRQAVAVESERLDDGWMLRAMHFVGDARGNVVLIGIVHMPVDANGVASPNVTAWRFSKDPLALAFMQVALHAMLYTFAMMNCNNVSLIHGGRTDDGLTNRQKREPGRGGLAYKVLKVRAGGREYVLGRGTSGESAALPLHAVRGHFKTYTPERPLFGERTGRYWWPAHARGNPENGEIRKRYDVDGGG